MMADPKIESLPFATRLRVRRVIGDVRQDRLAAVLGIHSTMLNHYERGARVPPDTLAFEVKHRKAVDGLRRHP